MILREFIKNKEESKITTFLASPTQERSITQHGDEDITGPGSKPQKLPVFQPKPNLTARPHEAISVCLKNLHVI